MLNLGDLQKQEKYQLTTIFQVLKQIRNYNLITKRKEKKIFVPLNNIIGTWTTIFCFNQVLAFSHHV